MSADDAKAAPSLADWSEDFSHENGQYWNQCSQCSQMFIGHKRRVVCKVCAAPSIASWFAEMYCHDTDRMPDEIAYHERILAALRAVETAQSRIDFEADRCERLMDENERLERAVEAVRAFSRDCGDNSDPSYAAGYRNGVEAVQALLEGER